MQNQNQKGGKVLLTGGHAGTTALSLIEEFDLSKIKVYWIGAVSAFEGKKVKTIEEKSFDRTKVKTYRLYTGKINRKSNWKTMVSLLKSPIGFLAALWYLLIIRPNVVVSFGGSVSIPVIFVSWIFRKPIIIHEQTIVAGKANTTMARFADVIAVAREESIKYFPRKKTVVTGNPIGRNFLKIRLKSKISNPPKLLIFGGSRGASLINNHIINSLHTLLDEFEIYHITGQIDFNRMSEIKKTISKKKNKYYIYDSVSPKEMHKFYDRADVILARAGANTVSEVLAAKRPTVFLPIAWVYQNEQTKNAKYVEKLGLGIVLDENKSDTRDIVMALRNVLRNWNQMVASVANYTSPDINAAQKLAKIVLEHIK